MELLSRIEKAHVASQPELLFGDLGDNSERADRLKSAFRKMAVTLHPDRHPGNKRVAEAMSMLNVLHDLAEKRIATGVYGTKKSSEPVTITLKHVYEDVRPLVAGDVCDVYEGFYFEPKAGGKRGAVIKLLRDERDTDLIDNEARVLTKLWKAPQADIKVFGKYLPRLLDSGRIKLGGKLVRANVVKRPSARAFTLAEVMKAYPDGVPPEHVAWMWNRMLEAIAFVHQQGHVHGALTPNHFLIKPDEHGGKLIDFSYAVPIGGHITAISSDDVSFYPPEILEKKPASPATDLYMSAMCAVVLMNGKIEGHFRKLDDRVPRVHPAFAGIMRACMLSQYARHQRAADVHKEFSRILRATFGPSKFIPFHMPEPL